MGVERRTPLYDLHLAHGPRMVDFAGYQMPVQDSAGILAETLHARAWASVFDVSHMGQLDVLGATAEAAMETLLPADLLSLGTNEQRYSVLRAPVRHRAGLSSRCAPSLQIQIDGMATMPPPTLAGSPSS